MFRELSTQEIVRYLFYICLGCIIIFSVYSAYVKNSTPYREKKIIAFGDSLVYGIGSQDSNDFPSQVSRKLAMSIENMGIPGETTALALLRLQEVLDKKPDIVIVLLGGNDALQSVNEEETFANLKTIITKIKENGGDVLLLGIRGRGILTDPYQTRFKILAREMKVPLVPNVLDGLFGNNLYMYDAVHPNNVGYGKIADKVYEKLVTSFW